MPSLGDTPSGGNDVPQLSDAGDTENVEEEGFEEDTMPVDDGSDPLENDSEEKENPKKYIQRLAGKLTSCLGNYEDEDAEEVNKYVAGMVVSQTVKNMSTEDADDVIKKIQKQMEESSEGEGNEGQAEDMNMQEPPADNSGNEQQPQQPAQQQPQMESRIRETRIDNLLGRCLRDIKAEKKTPKSEFYKGNLPNPYGKRFNRI